MEKLKYRDILYNDEQLGAYPTDKLKRVAEPTNRIPGPVEQRAARDSVFWKTILGEYGESLQERMFQLTVRYPLGASVVDIQRHINKLHNVQTLHRSEEGGGEKPASLLNPVAPKRAPIPDDPRVLSRHIKSLGYFLGADIVGIGPLAQSAVFTRDNADMPVEAPYKYAIVFACRKYDPTLRASNGWDQIVDALSFQAYARLAWQTEVMANYLRRLGIDAATTNMDAYLTLMPQVILDAGIGEVCRMGIVLNPFFGTNYKAAAVLTNLELETDGCVDFGLQEYCKKCSICADNCPAGAIPKGPQKLYNGYYTWPLDKEKCNEFFINNEEGCVGARCTKVCPWHRPSEPSDFADWDGSIEQLHAGVNRQRERLLENDFVDPEERTKKWWFELDEVDGEIVVPAKRNPHKICREYPLQ